MNSLISKLQGLNWNQGLHRVFALLCVLWVGYWFIYLPHQAVQEARVYAEQTGARYAELERHSPSLYTMEEKLAESKENWERATWSYVYREDLGRNLKVILGIVIIAPIAVYIFVRLLLMLLLWVYRGFKTTKEGA